MNLKKNSQKFEMSGHAEIEGGKTIFIYGSGLEVLNRKEF